MTPEAELVKGIIGKVYVFDDRDKIEVVQMKFRSEEEVLVTVHITQGPGIPRKLVFPILEFLGTYGYLFGIGEAPNQKTS